MEPEREFMGRKKAKLWTYLREDVPKLLRLLRIGLLLKNLLYVKDQVYSPSLGPR